MDIATGHYAVFTPEQRDAELTSKVEKNSEGVCLSGSFNYVRAVKLQSVIHVQKLQLLLQWI